MVSGWNKDFLPFGPGVFIWKEHIMKLNSVHSPMQKSMTKCRDQCSPSILFLFLYISDIFTSYRHLSFNNLFLWMLCFHFGKCGDFFAAKAVISGNLKSKLYILSRDLSYLTNYEYFGIDESKSYVNQSCNTTGTCMFL